MADIEHRNQFPEGPQWLTNEERLSFQLENARLGFEASTYATLGLVGIAFLASIAQRPEYTQIGIAAGGAAELGALYFWKRYNNVRDKVTDIFSRQHPTNPLEVPASVSATPNPTEKTAYRIQKSP